MPAFLHVRDCLNCFSAGLRLEEDELPSVFDSGLLDSARELEEAIQEAFSSPIADLAASLCRATSSLLDEPAPLPMAAVLECLSELTVALDHELRHNPDCSEYQLARQYSAVSEHLSTPKPAENQGFAELPRMLLSSPWMQSELQRLSSAASLDLARTPAGRGFSPTSARRWLKRVQRRPEAQLASQLERLRSGLEYRSRQVWYLRRTGGEEMPLTVVYSYAHCDMLPELAAFRNDREFSLEIAKLKGLALGLQLPEFALCYDSAEWIAQYALTYLTAPAPDAYPVHDAAELRHQLRCRLSRWYLNPFEHELEPLELCAGVLRMGRPLFYERFASHALLEYSLLQGIAFTRQAAPLYLAATPVFEEEFLRQFDGYLLRHLHYPRLKTPAGWCKYLAVLNDLHFGSGGDEELDAFRQLFLARRGLRSPLEILYRTLESHGAVN